MLAQRGQEEEPAAGAQLLELMRVGVERPQQARGEGHRGGAVREEGGVAGRCVVCMYGRVCGCGYMSWFRTCRLNLSSRPTYFSYARMYNERTYLPLREHLRVANACGEVARHQGQERRGPLADVAAATAAGDSDAVAVRAGVHPDDDLYDWVERKGR